ncbi:MAG: tetratricopeptide repeat protein [Candidatus Sulfotelmatobacter sp.]
MLTKHLFGPALLALTTIICISAPAQRSAWNLPPPINPPPPTRELIQDQTAAGDLKGKVTVKDGLLPWDPIPVTVSCNGKPAYTTVTDAKGGFGILPSQIPGEVSQQGDRERQITVHFEGCVVEAVLTGFSSSMLTITAGNLHDTPEIGTITLTREFAARGTAMSATSKTVPADASKHWSKAGEEILDHRPDRARRQLEEAVRIYPGFAEAWYQLGTLQLLSNPHEAQICLRKATTADPDFVPPHEQLAGLAVQQEDWPSALASVGHYLQLDPKGTIRIWYYSALSNLHLGNIAAAEISANKLLAMDPLHNIRNGEQLLAVIQARRTDYADALAHLRSCLSYVPEGPDSEMIRGQIAQLEKQVTKPK